MAVLCPQCGTELAKDGALDFGMATCPSCHAVVFIDIEGNAHSEIQNAEVQMDQPLGSFAEPSDSIEQNQSLQTAGDLESYQQFDGDSEEHSADQQHDKQSYQQTDEHPDQPNPQLDSNFELPADLQQQPNQIEDEQSLVDSPIGNYDSPQEYQEIAMDSGADSGESMTEFANSNTEKGSLNYTIVVSGIDTHELRQKIQEAFGAPQFQWNVNELMQSILDGRLEIKNVNAVKASRAVDVLKNLPLQISWSQHVY